MWWLCFWLLFVGIALKYFSSNVSELFATTTLNIILFLYLSYNTFIFKIKIINLNYFYYVIVYLHNIEPDILSFITILYIMLNKSYPVFVSILYIIMFSETHRDNNFLNKITNILTFFYFSVPYKNKKKNKFVSNRKYISVS